MKAVECILKYLKSCLEKDILFKKTNHLKIEGYVDADWDGSKDDKRSTIGYCIVLGGNLVTWRSKKQTMCTGSSAEAEYRAVAHGFTELLWLKLLLSDLRI